MSQSDDDQPFFLSPDDVATTFSRVAECYDEHAVLQRAVRDQLFDRLDVVTLRPARILEAGVATGESLAPLKTRYPEAAVVAVDVSRGMLSRAAGRAAELEDVQCIQADCHALPLETASVDLVVSNLMLAWCHDPEAVLAEFRRVLRPEGLLSFATFGPDTLKELRVAFAQADRNTHVHYFYDMHDIGDALQRAGFADPVMDTDYYTLTYAEPLALMRDLKAVGAHNLTAGRPRGLLGRRRFARVVDALAAQAVDGRVPATCEVIFGHAWAPAGSRQTRRADGAVGVPLDGIGRRSDESGAG